MSRVVGVFQTKGLPRIFYYLGYYWPTLFRDAKKYVRSCDNFHNMGCLIATNEMPLHPQVLVEPTQMQVVTCHKEEREQLSGYTTMS